MQRSLSHSCTPRAATKATTALGLSCMGSAGPISSLVRYFGTAPGSRNDSNGVPEDPFAPRKKFKGLGAGFAKSLHKDISTAQVVAQSTATVAKQVAEEVSDPKSPIGSSTSLGSSVVAAAAGVAAATIPTSCVTATTAKLVPSVLQAPSRRKKSSSECGSNHRENCLLGWSPEQIYKVVSDVEQYQAFLPWCVNSTVESRDELILPPIEGLEQSQQKQQEAVEMKATLDVGFSFFREKYQSLVYMEPMHLIEATLHGKSTLLRELRCTWSFDPIQSSDHLVTALASSAAASTSAGGSSSSSRTAHRFVADLVRDQQLQTTQEVLAILEDEAKRGNCDPIFLAQTKAISQQVSNVRFEVGFDFRNAFHQMSMTSMVMSNVVTVMTKSFESRCQEMYGNPRIPRKVLPLEEVPAGETLADAVRAASTPRK